MIVELKKKKKRIYCEIFSPSFEKLFKFLFIVRRARSSPMMDSIRKRKLFKKYTKKLYAEPSVKIGF